MNKVAKMVLLIVIVVNAASAISMLKGVAKAVRFNPADYERKELAELAKTLIWRDGHGLYPAVAALMCLNCWVCWRVLTSCKKDDSKQAQGFRTGSNMNKSAKMLLVTVVLVNAATTVTAVYFIARLLRFTPADREQKELAELAQRVIRHDGYRAFPVAAGLMCFTSFACWRVLAGYKKEESKKGCGD